MTSHTESKPNRINKGVPTAGRFTNKVNSPGPELRASPSIDPSFVEEYLASNKRYEGTTPEMVEAITARLNLTRNFSDQHIEQVADEMWLQSTGVTPAEEEDFSGAMERVKDSDPESWETIRAYLKAKEDFAVGHTFAPPEPAMGMEFSASATPEKKAPSAPDGITTPVSSKDPRFQNGEVFDRIMVDGREFRRAGSEDAEPFDTQAIRLQASRPLNETEAYAIAGVLGHANREAIGGEPLGLPGAAPNRDSPYSFIADIDTNKGRRQDFALFEKLVPNIIANGSDVRSTNRSGPGTMGTRKIEPFGDPNLSVTLYYQV